MKANPNPIQLDSVKLRHIIERIVKKFSPQKIILFGSRAEGRAQEQSDVDLLVVMDRVIDRKIKFEFASELSMEVGIQIQLIPMVRETYEETKDVIGGIAYPATKYGVAIYENP